MWLRNKQAAHKRHWGQRNQRYNSLSRYTKAIKTDREFLPAPPAMVPYGSSLDIVLYGSTKAERVPNPPCRSLTVRERIVARKKREGR